MIAHKYETYPKGMTGPEVEAFRIEWEKVTKLVKEELEKRGNPTIWLTRKEKD